MKEIHLSPKGPCDPGSAYTIVTRVSGVCKAMSLHLQDEAHIVSYKNDI